MRGDNSGTDVMGKAYIAVNPAKHAGINYTNATKLIECITSSAGQQAIADFKVNGEQVFFPNYGKTVASGK